MFRKERQNPSKERLKKCEGRINCD